MSKKKTEAEMREIAEMIKNMVKDWNEDEEKEPVPCENCKVHNDCPYWYGDEDEDDETETEDEEETEDKDCHCCDRNCKDCIYWDDDECCCAFDNKTEAEDDEDEEEDEEEEEEYYRYPECECVDGECDQCDHWVNTDYCELDDIYENCEGHEICGCSDEDCYSCKDSKEHTQIEDLSKFITSVNTVLGSNMGLLVFDKSNKKDMKKIAAIFREYAKRLS